MKTIIITALFFITASAMQANCQAPWPVDDNQGLTLNEEAYVNDIPFDTWMISKHSDPDILMLALPEEEYVDDIPFNTAKIAQKVLLSRVMKQNEEASVNDIPFNTNKIYNQAQMKQFTALWQEEQNVDDIPFESPKSMFCCTKSDFLIYQGGSTSCIRGFKGLNNIDFILDTEKYMVDFNERIKGLENLSLEYPF